MNRPNTKLLCLYVDITIPNEQEAACLKAINEMYDRFTLMPFTKHISERPDGGFENLQTAFVAWNFFTRRDEDGLHLESCTFIPEPLILRVITPFVKKGGELYCYTCDKIGRVLRSTYWCYEFHDGKVTMSSHHTNLPLGPSQTLTFDWP